MTDEPTPVIETEGLSVGYGDRVVQRGLNLRIARGEIFVLLGGSGCGKSTVLRTLIGLVPPLAGRVRILGRVFAEAGREPDEDPAILRHIGVMFQNGALFGSKTLLENCALPQETLTDRAPEEIERISRDRLRDVGLLDFADFLPKEISGGMQKRAAIARALTLDPDILFRQPALQLVKADHGVDGIRMTRVPGFLPLRNAGPDKHDARITAETLLDDPAGSDHRRNDRGERGDERWKVHLDHVVDGGTAGGDDVVHPVLFNELQVSIGDSGGTLCRLEHIHKTQLS